VIGEVLTRPYCTFAIGMLLGRTLLKYLLVDTEGLPKLEDLSDLIVSSRWTLIQERRS